MIVTCYGYNTKYRQHYYMWIPVFLNLYFRIIVFDFTDYGYNDSYQIITRLELCATTKSAILLSRLSKMIWRD